MGEINVGMEGARDGEALSRGGGRLLSLLVTRFVGPLYIAILARIALAFPQARLEAPSHS